MALAQWRTFPTVQAVLALPTRKEGQFHLKRSQKYLIHKSKEKQTALSKEKNTHENSNLT
jgi:hypothetical protein